MWVGLLASAILGFLIMYWSIRGTTYNDKELRQELGGLLGLALFTAALTAFLIRL